MCSTIKEICSFFAAAVLFFCLLSAMIIKKMMLPFLVFGVCVSERRCCMFATPAGELFVCTDESEKTNNGSEYGGDIIVTLASRGERFMVGGCANHQKH